MATNSCMRKEKRGTVRALERRRKAPQSCLGMGLVPVVQPAQSAAHLQTLTF